MPFEVIAKKQRESDAQTCAASRPGSRFLTAGNLGDGSGGRCGSNPDRPPATEPADPGIVLELRAGAERHHGGIRELTLARRYLRALETEAPPDRSQYVS